MVERYAQPNRLRLVQTYYPQLLAVLVIRCCLAQLRGVFTRTCRNRYCPACCPMESRRIYLRQYARFQRCTPRGKRVRIAHEVYTLPENLRPLLATREGFAAYRRAVLETIRETHGANVAGVMNLHAHGDEDITKFHPHWDVIINGYVPTNRGWREHRPPRLPKDDIRSAYRMHLKHELGLQAEPPKVNLWIDDAYGRFHTREGVTRHKIAYSSRNVYAAHNAWLNDTGTSGDWCYMPSEKKGTVYTYEGRDVIQNLTRIDTMLRGRQRRVWFGFMANRTASKTVRNLGHDAETESG